MMLDEERKVSLGKLTVISETLRTHPFADNQNSRANAAAACAKAAALIEALGFALDEAISDLQHMGGCPSCLYNCAPNPHGDTAICERRLFFPLKGCYVWKGWKDRARPNPGEEARGT